jgi:hypothetical protein
LGVWASRTIEARTQREEYKLPASRRESDKETRFWSMTEQLPKNSLVADTLYGHKSSSSALQLVLQGKLFELRTGELCPSSGIAPYLF